MITLSNAGMIAAGSIRVGNLNLTTPCVTLAD